MIRSAMILSAVALLLTGCSGIDVNYTGESLSPVESSKFIKSAPAGAELIGEATAAGPAALTREKVEDALLVKAREVGASYVVITDQQVVPNLEAGPVARESASAVWAEDSAAIDTWSPLQRDFGGGYGTADISPILGFGGGGTNRSQPVSDYKRIIYAKFYK